MNLENKYYRLVEQKVEGLHGTYHIALLPGCEVYQGHFPGRPVCPGVCNIEVIKECAIRLTGQPLIISSIKQCRLTNLATPDTCPQLVAELDAKEKEGGYEVTATIKDDQRTYVEFKGNLTAV